MSFVLFVVRRLLFVGWLVWWSRVGESASERNQNDKWSVGLRRFGARVWLTCKSRAECAFAMVGIVGSSWC